MIDLALNNIWLLGAALVIGIITGRWAFSNRKAPAPKPKQEDEAQP
jgi:hypothetical protein